jgi:hypothetical protein
MSIHDKSNPQKLLKKDYKTQGLLHRRQGLLRIDVNPSQGQPKTPSAAVARRHPPCKRL